MAKVELVGEFLRLRAEGWSYARIKGEIGVSKTTQVAWTKKNRRLLERMRGEKLQEVADELLVSRVARVRRFAAHLDSVEHELQARDLSAVQTVDLMRGYLRVLQYIGREVDPEMVSSPGEVGTAERYAAIVARCSASIPLDLPGLVEKVERDLTNS